MNDKRRSYKTFGKRRSLRLRGFDYRSPYDYHLTWGTAKRKPVLIKPPFMRRLIGILEEEASGMLIYAYCFMPDHVHLLLRPEEGEELIQFIQVYKGRTTHAYWEMGGKGRLWQRGFYDHILRQEEDVRQVARYILGNPVRKRMTENLVDYPFSGSLVFKKHEL